MTFLSVLGRGMLTATIFLPVGLTYGGSIVGCSKTQIVEPNNTPDVDESEYQQSTADDFSALADTVTSSDEFAMTPDILDLVNMARSAGRECGDKFFSQAPAITWSSELAAAALAHARDMADNDYYSHCGRRGEIKPTDTGTKGCLPGMTQPWDRAKEAGYATSYVGENIAIGQRTIREVMSSWLDSPGHCANIMNPKYREVGVAFSMGFNTQHSSSGKTFLWAMSLGGGTSEDTSSTGGSTTISGGNLHKQCDERMLSKQKEEMCKAMVDFCTAAGAASAKITLNIYAGSRPVGSIDFDNAEQCIESAFFFAGWGFSIQ